MIISTCQNHTNFHLININQRASIVYHHDIYALVFELTINPAHIPTAEFSGHWSESVENATTRRAIPVVTPKSPNNNCMMHNVLTQTKYFSKSSCSIVFSLRVQS